MYFGVAFDNSWLLITSESLTVLNNLFNYLKGNAVAVELERLLKIYGLHPYNLFTYVN